MNISNYPFIKLYTKDNKEVIFNGERRSDDVARFINRHCGTERGPDGIVIQTSGLIEGARELIVEFAESDDKQSVIEKFRSLPNSDFYVKLLQRVLQNGRQSLNEDVLKMETVLIERKSSISSLDGVKRRFNILSQVIHTLSKYENLNSPDTTKSEQKIQEEL